MPAKIEIDDNTLRDPLAAALGQRIARIRSDRIGLSARQLALRMGVSAAYMWRVEDGRQNLSLRNLARIAKALNVTLSDLVDGIDVDAVALENRDYARQTEEDER